MTGWLTLNTRQRRAVIDLAAQKSGISAKAIEKDWWVTLTLKALFQSAYTGYMVFKGGTSLSKGWKLIDRFSEDIDIALDPAAFGTPYQTNPSGSYVKGLKRRGCAFTSGPLKAELEQQFNLLGVPAGLLTIEAAAIRENHPDTDPQTLYVRYPSLYDPNPYLPDEVKIEVGVRSLQAPSVSVNLHSILHEFHPLPVYQENPFPVELAASHKTFLEKVFLLHEEFQKPGATGIRTLRMSRHLYDIARLMQGPTVTEALNDHNLYSHLVDHRRKYHALTWVDYDTHHHQTIRFLPPASVMEQYRQDYEAMREQMIYGETEPFDLILQKLYLLQGKLRVRHLAGIAFEDLIALANESLAAQQPFTPGALYTFETAVPVVEGKEVQTVPVRLSFRSAADRLYFEQIEIINEPAS